MPRRNRDHQKENKLASLRDIDLQGQEPSGTRGANNNQSTAQAFAELRDQRHTSAIQISDNQLQQYGRFEFSKVGLIVPEDMTDEEYEAIGNLLLEMQGAIQWWIGDWARWESKHKSYGEKYEMLIAKTGFARQTIENWRWVASAYPKTSLRKEDLSFSHHLIVARREDRAEILAQASNEGWSVRQLKDHLAERDAEDTNTPTRLEQARDKISHELNKVIFSKQLSATERRQLFDYLREELNRLEATLQQD